MAHHQSGEGRTTEIILGNISLGMPFRKSYEPKSAHDVPLTMGAAGCGIGMVLMAVMLTGGICKGNVGGCINIGSDGGASVGVRG